MYSYTVRCKFSQPDVSEGWLSWLADEHIQDVLDAGASSAEIFDMGDSTYEIRYCFGSVAEFEAYERDHAPRLRKEGLSKFPLSRGLEYSRSAGQLLRNFGG